MASHRIPQYFLNPRLSLWSVAVVFTLMWHLSVSDIQLKGEVGGSVTFHCPVDKQKSITLFYLMKGLEFVNGYYVSKNEVKGWENTKLDLINTNVNIYNLSVSHSGDYHWQIMYEHDDIPNESPIHLSVTANYSKPEVTMNCEGLHCLVKCSSHGGYPSRKIMWNVPGIQIWKIVNSNETSDPVTMLVNSSSTASFDCSKGKLQFSCSVDNVTSDSFSVCTTEDPQDFPYVLAAICGVVLCIIILVVVLLWRYKKRQGSAPVNGGPECGVQGCPEEDMPLKGKEGEVER